MGTGVEGRALLLSARRAPPLRAANGIDSIKRRGNEERESEATPSPPPPSAMLSRQRGRHERKKSCWERETACRGFRGRKVNRYTVLARF